MAHTRNLMPYGAARRAYRSGLCTRNNPNASHVCEAGKATLNPVKSDCKIGVRFGPQLAATGRGGGRGNRVKKATICGARHIAWKFCLGADRRVGRAGRAHVARIERASHTVGGWTRRPILEGSVGVVGEISRRRRLKVITTTPQLSSRAKSGGCREECWDLWETGRRDSCGARISGALLLLMSRAPAHSPYPRGRMAPSARCWLPGRSWPLLLIIWAACTSDHAPAAAQISRKCSPSESALLPHPPSVSSAQRVLGSCAGGVSRTAPRHYHLRLRGGGPGHEAGGWVQASAVEVQASAVGVQVLRGGGDAFEGAEGQVREFIDYKTSMITV